MDRKIFMYLVPVYIAWSVLHTFFFIGYILHAALANQAPRLTVMGPLMASHMLVIACGIAFMIFMLIDCVKRQFRTETERIIWVLVIVLFSIIGSIVYFYVHGRFPLARKAPSSR